jgi:hypothetical protein
MYAMVAGALQPDGRFVFSAHHYGRRAVWDRVEKAGYYSGTELFREFLTADEMREEAGRYFGAVRLQPIQIVLPVVNRLPVPPVIVSRVCERMPVLRDFGQLVVATATRPNASALT